MTDLHLALARLINFALVSRRTTDILPVQNVSNAHVTLFRKYIAIL